MIICHRAQTATIVDQAVNCLPLTQFLSDSSAVKKPFNLSYPSDCNLVVAQKGYFFMTSSAKHLFPFPFETVIRYAQSRKPKSGFEIFR